MLGSRAIGGRRDDGEGEGSEDEVPDRLFLRLSNRELRHLSEEESAILYGVKKVANTQRHFKDSTWK